MQLSEEQIKQLEERYVIAGHEWNYIRGDALRNVVNDVIVALRAQAEARLSSNDESELLGAISQVLHDPNHTTDASLLIAERLDKMRLRFAEQEVRRLDMCSAQADAWPVAWALTYDDETPCRLYFKEEDCDTAVQDAGRSAAKMPLYTHPAPAAAQAGLSEAFREACSDLGAISALLGFGDGFPGIDPILAAITNLGTRAPATPQSEPVSCTLGCKDECKADLHGCASECPSPKVRAALATQSAQPAELSDSSEIACSSCGLTMADSQALAAMKQPAEPSGDERALAAWGEYQARESYPGLWRMGPAFIAGYKEAAQSGQRAGVAEGWQVVPVEPTAPMLIAGENYIGRHAYARMLAAAPTQQRDGGEDGK